VTICSSHRPAPGQLQEASSRAQSVLDHDVRPYMQSHGGDVSLVGIERGVLEVQMRSACGACELKPVTFASRIRPALLAIPGVEEVRCASVPLTPARLDQIAEFFA
jgi:Fe-S cluster biogenesis protein NfuA